jgi:hypothetical protein
VLLVALGCGQSTEKDAAELVGFWRRGGEHAPASTEGFTDELAFYRDGTVEMRTVISMGRERKNDSIVSGEWSVDRGVLHLRLTFSMFGLTQIEEAATEYRLEGNKLKLMSLNKTYWRIEPSPE